MKCMKCGKDFEEKDIQESHDVPCYLFYWVTGRRLRKQEADKYGRHWLCNKCHKEYEESLHGFLLIGAEEFARDFFWEDKNEEKS